MKWFARHRGKGWATCPFTQAGFVRIVSNPAFSRDAVQPRDAAQVLLANTAAKDHVFWSDDLPFAEAVAFAGVRLMGHQQVTDAYLLPTVAFVVRYRRATAVFVAVRAQVSTRRARRP